MVPQQGTPVRVYQVHLVGQSRVALGGTPQSIAFQLDGVLVLRDGGTGRLLAALEAPRLSLTQNGTAQLGESTALQRELCLPFVIQRSARGGVGGLAFSHTLSDGARQTLRSLVSFWQTSTPQKNLRESDVAGDAEVTYSKLAPQLYEKRVVRYVTRPDDLTRRLPEGTQRIRFTADGAVLNISGTRTVRTLLAERELACSILSGTVLGLPSRRAPKPISPLLSAALEPLSPPESTAAQQQRLRTTTLGKSTPAELVATLEALPATASQQDANALYLKLRALLTLQPTALASFAPYLQTADAKTRSFRALVDAIHETGAASGQTLLTKVARQRTQDPDFLSVVLPALGTLSTPSPETEALLLELSSRDDDVGQGATLLLGTLAHTLQGTPRGAALFQHLLERLRGTESETGRVLLLGALGNTGQPALVSALRPFLAEKSPTLRSAALSALRLVPGPEAETLLLSALRADPEPSVRASAAFALSFLPRSVAVTKELAQKREKD